MERLVQQGDVLFFEVGELPEGSVKKSGVIIAEGESTGHAHTLVLDRPLIAELYEKDGLLYVKAVEKVSVKHQEHKTITLNPGIWKVGRVREYDHFTEEARRVQD